MAIATFSETARLMGDKTRSVLYRLKRDGYLNDYLIRGGGKDQLLLAPNGQPKLNDYLASILQWKVNGVINNHFQT